MFLTFMLYLTGMQGETHLPLPPDHEKQYGSVETASKDKVAVHTLESVIVDWIRQIRVRLPLAPLCCFLCVSTAKKTPIWCSYSLLSCVCL